MMVSAFVGYWKGKSSLMPYEQSGKLKFQYRTIGGFWCRGCHADTEGRNKTKIAEYIGHQLAEDKFGEQRSIPYAGSPFMDRR